MNPRPIIVWLRQDLRLEDHPALSQAAARKQPVLPVYVWAPEEEGVWSPGGASRWWLHRSLESLGRSLERAGSRLLIRRGPARVALLGLARETGAAAVFWNRRYEPLATKRDAEVKDALRAEGIEARSFNGSLLFEPWEIGSADGGPVKVFTPFWKRCLARPEPPAPTMAPSWLPGPPKSWPETLELEALALQPKIDWASGLRSAWDVGERGAGRALDAFLETGLGGYASERNRPDHDGVSRLSPYLHFGEISSRRVWHEVRRHSETNATPGLSRGAEAYLRQVIWREFAHHLLFHFPHTSEAPLRGEFQSFPWSDDAEALAAWQRGRTGYPVVDAGMRQLWTTGWMHNRVRLVVASFLVKDLLVPWQRGAEWFWDTLVDADLANNSFGWQWTAGCGADAAPYFRVFNPVLQGEKLDPDGEYVRRWVPELARMPARWIHRPWEASGTVLEQAGVELGRDYPEPIVDHALARERALAAFDRVKRQAR